MPGATVQVSSLPNHILSDAMMSATLDQAQLDKFVLNFVTKPGACRGEAIITLSSTDAAIKCARHFHGRRWDASGIPVNAQVVKAKASPKPLPTYSALATASALPMSAPALKKKSFAFSAAAVAFVPGMLQTTSAPSKATFTIGSDVSTDDGDSVSSSDEKDGTPRCAMPVMAG